MRNKIIAMVLVFLLASVCVSCDKPEVEQDIEAIPFVEQFIADAGKYNVNVSKANSISIYLVDMTDTGAPAIAYDNSIQIDIDRWNYWNDIQKQWIVYHELGHNVLDRRHEEDGMMASNMPRWVRYEESLDSHIEQLFR